MRNGPGRRSGFLPGRGGWIGCSALLLVSGATWVVAAGQAFPGLPQIGSVRDERAFIVQNEAAMTRMMAGMSIKPTGDVDRDFVDMMAPHHQGAIDMALLVLRYGRNEQIRRLAQEIIVDQQQEIAAMRLAVGEPLAPSVAAPTMQPQRPTPMSGMNMR